MIHKGESRKVEMEKEKEKMSGWMETDFLD
jgi:hypothetical protein